MQDRPVAVIGLGLVGQALARRFRAAGWRTLGYDIRPEAREAFANAGGDAVDELGELGRSCTQAVLAVFDTAGVLQVLEGEAPLLAPGHRIETVVDCSTGDPELLEALALRLHARGIALVESPLSGSSQQVAAGEAVALLGGEAEAIARAGPLLDAIATQRLHVGAAGAGARAKLATNLVLGLNRAVLAEGMAFAQSLGIAPDVFLALVLATPARSVAAEVKGPLMVARDFTPHSRIRQHLKDVNLMLAAARRTGASLPFSHVHAQLMQAAVDAGEGDLDNAAILLRFLEQKDA